jgi:hypothetical protein
MTTATKTQSTVEDATAQVQELNERFVESSKKAAAEYLNLTEKAAQSIVGFQRQLAAQTDVEWVASLLEAQAQFTGDVTNVLVSSGRELLK